MSQLAITELTELLARLNQQRDDLLAEAEDIGLGITAVEWTIDLLQSEMKAQSPKAQAKQEIAQPKRQSRKGMSSWPPSGKAIECEKCGCEVYLFPFQVRQFEAEGNEIPSLCPVCAGFPHATGSVIDCEGCNRGIYRAPNSTLPALCSKCALEKNDYPHRESRRQQTLATGNVSCPPAPKPPDAEPISKLCTDGKAHFWVIDNEEHAVCKKCNVEKDFPSMQSTS